MKPRYHGLSLALIVIGLDQISKYYASMLLLLHQPVAILPSFNLMLIHNTGAAFSILSEADGWQRWFFICVASLTSLIITIWLWSLPDKNRLLAIAFGLILGGAIGNLIDRVILGYVIDFIELYYQDFYWPIFNIADSAITLGVILFFIDSFFEKTPH